MKATPLPLSGLLLIEPTVFPDHRGLFFESYNRRAFQAATGRDVEFVQDNHSHSYRNVLRGLHYQCRRPQAKLLRVVRGEIFDVAVDLRRHSPTFGRWVGQTLRAEDHQQVWIPEGFAHGFLVLSEQADVLYKTTDYYEPQDEHCLLWNDPAIGIEWPAVAAPLLSAKDALGKPLAEAAVFARAAGQP